MGRFDHRLTSPRGDGPPGSGVDVVPAWAWKWATLGALLWIVLVLVLVPVGTLPALGGDEGIELNKAVTLAREGCWDPRWWNDQPLTHTRWYAVMLGMPASPWGPRVWSLVCSGLMLAAVGVLTATASRSRWGLVAAMVGVAAADDFLLLSISAMQEVPMAGLGLAGVALVVGRPSPSRSALPWLLAAGTALVLAVSIKLTGLLYLGVAVLHLALGSELRGVNLRHALVFGLTTVAAAGGMLAIMDGRPASVLLQPHFASLGSAWIEDAGDQPWRLLARSHSTWTVLALLGAVVAVTEAGRQSALGLRRWILPILALGFAATIRPWWDYYIVHVLAGTAPLVGVAAGAVAGRASLWKASAQPSAKSDPAPRARAVPGHGAEAGDLKIHPGTLAGSKQHQTRSGLLLTFVPMIVLLGVLGSFMNELRSDLDRLRKASATPAMVEEIRRFQPVGRRATLYSADPMVAYWSGLRVPPELLVVTRKRLLSGDLSHATLPAFVGRFDCDFIVLPVGRLESRGEPWAPVLRDYVLAGLADGHELYVHRRLNPQPYQSRLRW